MFFLNLYHSGRREAGNAEVQPVSAKTERYTKHKTLIFLSVFFCSKEEKKHALEAKKAKKTYIR